MATYVQVAKETVRQLNKALKDKIPLQFNLPGDVNELTVSFNKFNPEDTLKHAIKDR